MQKDQQYTPKYWVVHSPESDDVDVRTLAKGRDFAINYWIEETYKERHGHAFDPDSSDESALDAIRDEFYGREDLTVSLVEINMIR